MSAIAPHTAAEDASFAGLRLTTDEFLALPDDGRKYELVDGVLLMSPSPTPRHQLVAAAIFEQLAAHVRTQRLGIVLYETDVLLARGAHRGDLVYRPEVIFISAERVGQIRDRICFAPDVAVEVISPESRSLDTRTKRDDYERAGVREYWLVDPEREAFTFLRLTGGRFETAASTHERYASAVVNGFSLDLAAVREAFHAF